jgi:hypothetical protein
MKTNTQILELEKQLEKMKAEVAAEKAAADATAAAEAEASLHSRLHSLTLSELDSKIVQKLLEQLETNTKEQTLALLDTDHYLQERNSRYSNLAPISNIAETSIGTYGLDRAEFVQNIDSKIRLVYDNFTLTCVDQVGGGEGSGEHWHSVIKAESRAVLGTSRYFYIPGWYASYNGTEVEYDGLYEVEPYEKVVIDWKAKK